MKASARHILVKDEELCKKIKQTIEFGADFAALAKKYSLCSSAERGGELGVFRKGMMVKEFDDVVFTLPTKILHGPVKSCFGFHLIEILHRENT
ncbi:peptidylprolyl isomerase [Kangiella sediminilitoris]|uniref:Peptidyl-prolyl cis-trans isomerase C n=1 Tax=Kangiella sediminilitoris TaxID=1144748 RepID=A0A1B3B9Z0_9GAMM|nr:peptidylprolyl isomerase [Kangiella sediminilitoris]AOE49630.1 PpiC-type peptidyl-prolyl cis-trans isomerase [Kangiella sediminilitoris]